MLGMARSTERGDTIIEVLFAVAIFSMIAVGSLTIMNQGTQAAQRALEITLVRQEMDAQAETLRFLHQSYVATYQRGVTPAVGTPAYEWTRVASRSVAAASGYGANGATTCPAMPGSRFVLNTHTAELSTVTPVPATGTFAQLRYSSPTTLSSAQGIWVEAVSSPVVPGQAGFLDFHIRTCWESPGSPSVMTLGTIVRLYEPRS